MRTLSFVFLAACGGAGSASQHGPSDLAHTIVVDASSDSADASSADGAFTDATTKVDGAVPVFDLGASNAPSVGLSFKGCSPDFSKNLIVVTGAGSMAVARSDAPASGEIQLHLTESSGTISITTPEREQTGDVINVIAGTTWTNVYSGATDPIAGTLEIHSYDESTAVVNLTFIGVVLQNPEDQSLCTVNGTLVTHGTT